MSLPGYSNAYISIIAQNLLFVETQSDAVYIVVFFVFFTCMSWKTKASEFLQNESQTRSLILYKAAETQAEDLAF